MERSTSIVFTSHPQQKEGTGNWAIFIGWSSKLGNRLDFSYNEAVLEYIDNTRYWCESCDILMNHQDRSTFPSRTPCCFEGNWYWYNYTCNETAYISFQEQTPLSLTMHSKPSPSLHRWKKNEIEKKMKKKNKLPLWYSKKTWHCFYSLSWLNPYKHDNKESIKDLVQQLYRQLEPPLSLDGTRRQYGEVDISCPDQSLKNRPFIRITQDHNMRLVH